MHNLLLGSAEKVCECGIEKNILKEKSLEEIDPLIQKVPVPSNVGRVAGRGCSQMGGGVWPPSLKSATHILQL